MTNTKRNLSTATTRLSNFTYPHNARFLLLSEIYFARKYFPIFSIKFHRTFGICATRPQQHTYIGQCHRWSFEVCRAYLLTLYQRRYHGTEHRNEGAGVNKHKSCTLFHFSWFCCCCCFIHSMLLLFLNLFLLLFFPFFGSFASSLTLSIFPSKSTFAKVCIYLLMNSHLGENDMERKTTEQNTDRNSA